MKHIGLLFFGFLFSFSSHVVANEKIKNMSVLGDSVAVGFLADLKFGEDVPSDHPFIDILIDVYMGGDKEEARERANDLYLNEYRLSAFVGDLNSPDCYAHSCKLKLSEKTAMNHAFVGHKMSDVLKEQFSKLDPKAEYIIVEAGANDYCSDQPDDVVLKNFKSSYAAIIDKLAKLEKKPWVLFVSVPNVPQLFENIPGSLRSTTVDLPLIGEKTLTCGEIRDGGLVEDQRSCKRLAKRKPTDQDKKLWKDINDSLAEMVKQQKNDHFILSDDFNKQAITTADVSVDCFHPNSTGQKKLSELTLNPLKGFIQSISSWVTRSLTTPFENSVGILEEKDQIDRLLRGFFRTSLDIQTHYQTAVKKNLTAQQLDQLTKIYRHPSFQFLEQAKKALQQKPLPKTYEQYANPDALLKNSPYFAAIQELNTKAGFSEYLNQQLSLISQARYAIRHHQPIVFSDELAQKVQPKGWFSKEAVNKHTLAMLALSLENMPLDEIQGLTALLSDPLFQKERGLRLTSLKEALLSE